MPEFFQQPATLSALIAFIIGFIIAALIFKGRLNSIKAAAEERAKANEKTIQDLQDNQTTLKIDSDSLRASETLAVQRQIQL